LYSNSVESSEGVAQLLQCDEASRIVVTEATYSAGNACGLDVLAHIGATCNGQQQCAVAVDQEGVPIQLPAGVPPTYASPVDPCVGSPKRLDLVYR
jgi:hypothetical protein